MAWLALSLEVAVLFQSLAPVSDYRLEQAARAEREHELRKLRDKRYVDTRAAIGVCRDCPAAARPGKRTCAPCGTRRADAQAVRDQRRREARS